MKKLWFPLQLTQTPSGCIQNTFTLIRSVNNKFVRSETFGEDFVKTDFHDVMTFKIWRYRKHILK